MFNCPEVVFNSGALLVPSASIVFGYGFYSVQTTKSAVTKSGIRRTQKQPPTATNCNLPYKIAAVHKKSCLCGT